MEGRTFHVTHTFLFPHLKKNKPKKYIYENVYIYIKLYITWNDTLASVIEKKIAPPIHVCGGFGQ